MKIVGVVVARMSSGRLPGKCLLPLAGRTSLERHVERFRPVPAVSEVWLATSRGPENDPLVAEAERLGLSVHRGGDEDVVERFIGIGERSNADALVRVGCDKPLFCFDLLSACVASYAGEDYVHLKAGYTVGVSHEILSLRALRETHRHYRGTAIAQHIREHPHRFSIRTVEPDRVYRRAEYRLALDTPEDYALHKAVFEALAGDAPIPTRRVLAFLDDHPRTALLNRAVREKDVNAYCQGLEARPVLTVVADAEGRYVALDRSGEPIPYDDVAAIANDPRRWRRGEPPSS